MMMKKGTVDRVQMECIQHTLELCHHTTTWIRGMVVFSLMLLL